MQEKQISWVPILVGMFMLVLGVCGYILWQYLPRPVAPASAGAGPASGPGFEVRYNALIALAQRGSRRAVEHSPPAVAASIGHLSGSAGFAPAALVLQADDRLALLLEMLDEERQLRNFRLKLENGLELPDAQAAQTTVTSALKAIAELHRQQPDLPLAPLRPAIERLMQSEHPLVQQEAARTQTLVFAGSR